MPVSISSPTSSIDVWSSGFKNTAPTLAPNFRRKMGTAFQSYKGSKQSNFQVALAEQLRAQKDLEDINTRVESMIDKFEEASQEAHLEMMKSMDVPQDIVDKFLRRVESSGQSTKSLVQNAKGNMNQILEHHDKSKHSENEHLDSLKDWFEVVSLKYNPERMMGVPERVISRRTNCPISSYEQEEVGMTITLDDLDDIESQITSSLGEYKNETKIVRDKFEQMAKGFQSTLASSRKTYAIQIQNLEKEVSERKQNQEKQENRMKAIQLEAEENRARILEEGIPLRKKVNELEQELKLTKNSFEQRVASAVAKNNAGTPKSEEDFALVPNELASKNQAEDSKEMGKLLKELKASNEKIEVLENAAAMHATELETYKVDLQTADEAPKIEEEKLKKKIADLEEELAQEKLKRQTEGENVAIQKEEKDAHDENEFVSEFTEKKKDMDGAFEEFGNLASHISDNPIMQVSILKEFGNKYLMLIDKAQRFIADRRHFTTDFSFDAVVGIMKRSKAFISLQVTKIEVLGLAVKALVDAIDKQQLRITELEKQGESSINLSVHQKIIGKLENEAKTIEEKLALERVEKTNLIDKMNKISAESKQNMMKCSEDVNSFRTLIDEKNKEIFQLKGIIEKKDTILLQNSAKVSSEVVDNAKLGKAASDAKRYAESLEAKCKKLGQIIKNLQNEISKQNKSRSSEIDVDSILNEDVQPPPHGDKDKEIMELEKQRDSCIEALEVAKVDIGKLSTERTTLLEGLQKLESMVYSLEKRWNEARCLNTTQAIAFAELQRHAFATKIKIAWLAMEHRKQKWAVKSILKENERLVQHERISKLDDSAVRLQEAELKLEELRHQFSTAYDAAAKKESLIMSLQRQFQEVSVDLTSKNEVIATLRKELLALETVTRDNTFTAKMSAITNQSANLEEATSINDMFGLEEADTGDQSANVPSEDENTPSKIDDFPAKEKMVSPSTQSVPKKTAHTQNMTPKEAAQDLVTKIDSFVEERCGEIKKDLKSAQEENNVCILRSTCPPSDMCQ
jgi:hypothetical protein